MGHNLSAIIGNCAATEKLSADWSCAQTIRLPQGYCLIPLTDDFFDTVTAAFGTSNEAGATDLIYLTAAIHHLLCQYTVHNKLIYIETDYTGGVGTQAGVLYSNGQISVLPQNSSGTINRLLQALGVKRLPGKDEFDTLQLGRYRHTNDLVD